MIDRYLHCDLMFAGGNALNFAVFTARPGRRPPTSASPATIFRRA
ncbi:hypothetical protein QYS46_00130 [Klebsiella michiganensis]|nr:hypothetical protein [Klebsiella michiganensis]